MKNVLVLLVAGFLFSLAGCASDRVHDVGEDSREVRGGSQQPICAIKCIAPPAGCEYRGAVTTGPCNKVTCGHLVCDKKAPEPECCISCAAPPEGCHYEGMNGCGPCSETTCGSLVCDGSGI